MAEMHTEALVERACCLWKPAGRIDYLSAGEWGQRFSDAFTALPGGTRGLVLDLSAVEFLSSAGLRELMKLSRRCREGGRALVVCGLQDTVREVFEISRFNLVIPMHTGLAEAIAAVAADGARPC